MLLAEWSIRAYSENRIVINGQRPCDCDKVLINPSVLHHHCRHLRTSNNSSIINTCIHTSRSVCVVINVVTRLKYIGVCFMFPSLICCYVYCIVSLWICVCVCACTRTFGWYIEYVSVWVCELAPVYYMQFWLVLLLFCWNIYLCLRKSVCVCVCWVVMNWKCFPVPPPHKNVCALTRTIFLPSVFCLRKFAPPQSFPRCRACAQGACDVSHSWGRKLVHGNVPHTFVCREDPPPPIVYAKTQEFVGVLLCIFVSIYFRN